MKLSYHPVVQRDVGEILQHYRREGGYDLADRFWNELMARLSEVAAHPERFSFYLWHPYFRRARLKRFPYLIVFRILKDRIRVTVVKHERRLPSFGMGRQ